jgi:tRNA threonylcarbamoyladenosine biosynthesis protein TsaB
MLLLIDTSSPGIGLALHRRGAGGDEVFIAKRIETGKQSLALPEEAENFLRGNGAGFRDLTAVGVVSGPGSFTGIRLGIAYAKGLALGLGVPVLPVNAFEIYLEKSPEAFVAIESGKGDFFVGARGLPPQIMTIEEVESRQFGYEKTVGHRPYDLADAAAVACRKLASAPEPVIPLYIRASYAEQACKPS